jgi:hypothetical protein
MWIKQNFWGKYQQCESNFDGEVLAAGLSKLSNGVFNW